MTTEQRTPESFMLDVEALELGKKQIQSHLKLLVARFNSERKRGFNSYEGRLWDSSKPNRKYFAMIWDDFSDEDRDPVTISSQALATFRRYASQFYSVEYWSDIMGPELRFFEKSS